MSWNRQPHVPFTTIALLRIVRGLYQRQVGEATMIHPPKVCAAERGEPTLPGLRKKLSEYYGIEESLLFNSDGFAREATADNVRDIGVENIF